MKIYRFYPSDHLGSTGAVVDDVGTVLETFDYYPYGLAMHDRSVNTGNPNDDVKFTGYELDDEADLTLYHANARMYDPVIGRFMQVDPRVEKYPEWSPYNYALNNPMFYVDPQGDTVRVHIETQGVGHVWISTGEGENMTVYTFGRYAGTDVKSHGINAISDGPGILVKLEGDDALAYNEEKSEETEVSVFKITDVSDKSVANVMDNMFNSSSKLPDKGTFKNDSRARVVSDYKLLNNNCTTVVCGALNQAGSSTLNKTIINPAGPSIHTYKKNIVVPSSLLRFLRQAEGVKNGN